MIGHLRIALNGRAIDVEADPLAPLQAVVHDLLGMRSVRLACGVGACGACTVLLDGEPARSCLVPAGLAAGREIVTSEALSDDHPVRQAFVAEHAYQCGYCIPGFVLSTVALLARSADPGPAEVDAALDGHLCRCGSYAAIRRAVVAAAQGGERIAGAAGSGDGPAESFAAAIASVDEQGDEPEREGRRGEDDEAAGPAR